MSCLWANIKEIILQVIFCLQESKYICYVIAIFQNKNAYWARVKEQKIKENTLKLFLKLSENLVHYEITRGL